MEEGSKKIRWNLEKVLQLFEQNDIKNISQLQQISSGALNWAYHNGVVDELPFKNKTTKKRRKKKVHDINRVIDYLQRWAKEEGTTVERQAAKYGYAEEYKKMIEIEEEKDIQTNK